MTHFSIKNATMFQSLPLKEHFRARWISLARKLLSPPTTPALSWTCGHPVWARMLDPENPVWGLMYFLQNLLWSLYGQALSKHIKSKDLLHTLLQLHNFNPCHSCHPISEILDIFFCEHSFNHHWLCHLCNASILLSDKAHSP